MPGRTFWAFVVCAALSASLPAAEKHDVAYAHPGDKTLLLDAHVPEGAGPFPAVIFVHGGGFDTGSKSTNTRTVLEPVERAGYAWFSIDFRMAPEFQFAQTREDIESAIRWVKANASEYKVNAGKLALIGESSGALLANYVGTHETPETRVAAVVDLYGPVDYSRLALERIDHPERFNMASINRHAAQGGGTHFFGVHKVDTDGLRKLYELAPIAAVHKGMAPFLCIHGTKDDQVPYQQSVAMCNAMKAVEAGCELITIEGGGHSMSGWRAPEMQHWKAELVAWLDKTLQVARAAAL